MVSGTRSVLVAQIVMAYLEWNSSDEEQHAEPLKRSNTMQSHVRNEDYANQIIGDTDCRMRETRSRRWK